MSTPTTRKQIKKIKMWLSLPTDSRGVAMATPIRVKGDIPCIVTYLSQTPNKK